MRQDSRVLIPLILLVGVIAQAGCKSDAPANGNKPVANKNVSTVPNTNSSSTPSNQNKPANQNTSSNLGTIQVTSQPTGARVLLVATDEDSAGEPQPKGLTPAMIGGIKPGKYTVDVEMAGYKFFQKEVTVKAGASVLVNAVLKKQ